MDLPVGDIKERHLLLKQTDIVKKISELMKKGFSGYAVLTIEGRSGVEEGAAILLQGSIIGAIFEYIKFDRKVFGDSALLHFLNASRADFGVGDIVLLSKQQIELILAFNEKIELGKAVEEKDLHKLAPQEYNPKFAENFLGEELQTKESKFDVFKKIGLAEFSRRFH